MAEPAPLPTPTPPGWYAEPTTGRQRYWDGIQWAFYPDEETRGPEPVPRLPFPEVSVVTNGMATASLVLGIVGVVLCFLIVPAVLALVFGIFGLSRARTRDGVGTASSVAGICLGGLGLVIFALTIAPFVT